MEDSDELSTLFGLQNLSAVPVPSLQLELNADPDLSRHDSEAPHYAHPPWHSTSLGVVSAPPQGFQTTQGSGFVFHSRDAQVNPLGPRFQTPYDQGTGFIPNQSIDYGSRHRRQLELFDPNSSVEPSRTRLVDRYMPDHHIYQPYPRRESCPISNYSRSLVPSVSTRSSKSNSQPESTWEYWDDPLLSIERDILRGAALQNHFSNMAFWERVSGNELLLCLNGAIEHRIANCNISNTSGWQPPGEYVFSCR